VCGLGPSDGLITNVALLGTGYSGFGGRREADASIRPGDNIEYAIIEGDRADDIAISGTAALSLQLDCVNPASTPSNSCSNGVPVYRSGETETRYRANTAKRSVPHNIMLLIDMNASMHVPVDPNDANPYDPFSEAPTDIGADPHDLRLESAKRLVGILNDDDHIGVVPFGFTNAVSVEATSVAQNINREALAFGPPNVDVRGRAIDELQAVTGGRSDLWNAVKTAYEFLLERPQEPGASNHLIVLAGGPDTCAGENRRSCAPPCSIADLPAFIARLQADQAAAKVHIHFVQFEFSNTRAVTLARSRSRARPAGTISTSTRSPSRSPPPRSQRRSTPPSRTCAIR